MTQASPTVDHLLRAAAGHWLIENRDRIPQINESPWTADNPFVWRAQEVFVEVLENQVPDGVDLNRIFDTTGRLMGAGWNSDEVVRLAPELIALYDRLRAIHDERADERLAERRREAEPRPGPPPIDAEQLWEAVRGEPFMGLLEDDPPIGGGVYALYDSDGLLLYVGKAMKFADRLKSHANDHAKRLAGFSYWSAWPIEGERERQAVEAHLIRTAAPLLNVAGR